MEKKKQSHAAEPSLLAGLLYDEAGQRLIPTHATKKGRRYRYYVSQALIQGAKDTSDGRRVPAGDLETLVEDRLKAFLNTNTEVDSAIEAIACSVHQRTRLINAAAQLAEGWSTLKLTEKRSILNVLIQRVDVMARRIEIQLYADSLHSVLDAVARHPQSKEKAGLALRAAGSDQPTLTLVIDARLRRAGMEMRLVLEGSSADARRESDRSLKQLLAKAYRYREMLMRSGGKTMEALAAEAGVGGPYFSRVLRLSFLAPDIVQTILQDRHAIEVNARGLAANIRLPTDWDEQRKLLGVS